MDFTSAKQQFLLLIQVSHSKRNSGASTICISIVMKVCLIICFSLVSVIHSNLLDHNMGKIQLRKIIAVTRSLDVVKYIFDRLHP